MGLYDRSYYQDEPPRSFAGFSGQRSMVVNLIIINAVIYAIDVFIFNDHLSAWMAANSETLLRPWMWWQLLTYGFAHSPDDAMHLIGNMIGLFFLGQAIEEFYGRRLFLRMYLTSLVFCSLVWCGTEVFLSVVMNTGRPFTTLVGASGAVTTVVMLFALNFPRRTVLFMFFIPMPAWVLGVGLIVFNLFGTSTDSRVAYDVHLVGALYGFIFFKKRWAIGALPGQLKWPSLPSRRPKLRVHDPEDRYVKLDAQADAVLEKLHRQGEASLSARERRVLEEYSRRMQQKHR